MLEFVHGHAKGDEGNRLLKIGKTELIRLIAKKPPCVGIGELLHGHGVDF